MTDWSGKAVHEFLEGEGSVLSMAELAARYLRQKDRAEKTEKRLEEISNMLLSCAKDEVLQEHFRDSCNHILTIFVRDGYLPSPKGWDLKKDGTPGFTE